MVIFVGIQATGKSTFFKQRFVDTHIRINLDMLKTRRRESVIIAACLQTRQPFVIDNTNVTIEARAYYIALARAYKFSVVGYYFASHLAPSLERNRLRVGAAIIPEIGVVATYNRLQIPTMTEGFDELSYVRIDETFGFVVEPWQDEI